MGTKEDEGVVDRGYLIADPETFAEAVEKSIMLAKMGVIRAVFMRGREDQAKRWLNSYLSSNKPPAPGLRP